MEFVDGVNLRQLIHAGSGNFVEACDHRNVTGRPFELRITAITLIRLFGITTSFGGLKAMVTVGRIHDPRCADALDLLESKQLPAGGWPAEKQYYKVSNHLEHNADLVDWGGASTRRLNPWVTVDALADLRAANRLRL